MDLYDRLPVVVPDYDYTLTIAPQGEMAEIGGDDGCVEHKGYGVSVETVELASQAPFWLEFELKVLTEEAFEIVFDLYHDPAKACGTARSFKRPHPYDGHTYVVRFDCELPWNLLAGGSWRIDGRVKLKLLGKI